ncbi:MAG: hypothetical protein OXQ92_05735 [Boseongicola sp.]|nr:hypothetical protein [Boseongicola sp.]
MRKVQKPRDFEKFYFRYVATGEGCGCAERIIDNHELDRKSLELVRSSRPKFSVKRLWSKVVGPSR